MSDRKCSTCSDFRYIEAQEGVCLLSLLNGKYTCKQKMNMQHCSDLRKERKNLVLLMKEVEAKDKRMAFLKQNVFSFVESIGL